jgi:hypothetical protein
MKLKSKKAQRASRKSKPQMSPAQLLKMAEQQIAFWKIVQVAAKAEIKAKDDAKGKKLRPLKKSARKITRRAKAR